MKYYAGMDVSLEETAICIVDETGTIMKEMCTASEPRGAGGRAICSWLAAGAGRPRGLLLDGLAA